MLVMSKTHHASELMSMLNQIPRTLLHTSESTAEGFMITPMAPTLDQDGCNMNGMFPKLQVHGHQTFVESIGGEESPATSDYIMLLAQYGFDQC